VLELANETYYQQAGLSEEEMLGRPIWGSLPELKAALHPLLQGVVETGTPYHGKELEVRRQRNGREELFYVDFVYHPLRDSEGRVTGIMSIGIEVTDQVLARKKVEDSEQELLHRVQERTAELEKKNSELEQFAFVASHDLQEPLRKIKAFGEILKDRYEAQLGEQGADLISRMQSAADRMRVLISALLSYSRVSANGEEYYFQDMNGLLREVIVDLETAIAEKGAMLSIGELLPVRGDGLQLRQLLQNLLSNALKFSKEEGTPSISITGRLVTGASSGFKAGPEPERHYQLIEVKDDGIGFEPQYADKIFQIFQRLHGKADYPGSGVGLSIVHDLLHDRLHRGEQRAGRGRNFPGPAACSG
jgi:PAS domain S-box-containing protein